MKSINPKELHMIEEGVLDHLTDEALIKGHQEKASRGSVAQAEALLQIHPQDRLEASQMATREMNMTGARYSDGLRSAVRDILRGAKPWGPVL